MRNRRQIDLSAGVITLMEKCGLVWNVVRIAPERQAQKLAATGAPRANVAAGD
jgi:stearoyl-CoA desaturase (delta-9 desaturase)